MRDGVNLAADLYLPPKLPGPTIISRLPYGRAQDKYVGAFTALARRGYVVVSQDCRGTGDSEPDHWDYYVYEPEDGFDTVEWVAAQRWCNGFIGSCGGSYGGQTQWCMALHPKMTTIVPEVSGLGVAANTTHLYMTLNAYDKTVGKGVGKMRGLYTDLERLILAETLAGGFFNEPLVPNFSAALLELFPQLETLPLGEARRWIWEHYCTLDPAGRGDLIKRLRGTTIINVSDVEALSDTFGPRFGHDCHTIPFKSPAELCAQFQAPSLMITGWYDWGVNDALATWELLQRHARPEIRGRCRLIITPAAHNVPGYHEGMGSYGVLQSNHRAVNQIGLLDRWYEAIETQRLDAWPQIIFYLMGANQWLATSSWPPQEAKLFNLYFGQGRTLTVTPPCSKGTLETYRYDPNDPTPTVGGSILSTVYPPGSVDVSAIHSRSDVIVFTSSVLQQDLDVVGPLRVVLYASSSAVDTDFTARLSDVFPDGRSIQLQNGILRARHRNLDKPTPLIPGTIYRFEIDLWATANRFKAGHRLRVDVSSSDFPRFDRNANLGGVPGDPVPAQQTLMFDCDHPSHIEMHVLCGAEGAFVQA